MKVDHGEGGVGFQPFGQRRGADAPNSVVVKVDRGEGAVGFQPFGQPRGANTGTLLDSGGEGGAARFQTPKPCFCCE